MRCQQTHGLHQHGAIHGATKTERPEGEERVMVSPSTGQWCMGIKHSMSLPPTPNPTPRRQAHLSSRMRLLRSSPASYRAWSIIGTTSSRMPAICDTRASELLQRPGQVPREIYQLAIVVLAVGMALLFRRNPRRGSPRTPRAGPTTRPASPCRGRVAHSGCVADDSRLYFMTRGRDRAMEPASRLLRTWRSASPPARPEGAHQRPARAARPLARPLLNALEASRSPSTPERPCSSKGQRCAR